MKYTIIESGINSVEKLPDRTWFYGTFRCKTGIWLRDGMLLYNVKGHEVYKVVGIRECIDDYLKIKHKYTVGVDVGKSTSVLPHVGSDFVGKTVDSWGVFHRPDKEHLVNISCGTIVPIPLGAEFLTEVQLADINLEFKFAGTQ